MVKMRERQNTPKGDLRRSQLCNAAAVILQEQGIESVRHRLVAERAGASLAATTYYFKDLPDLVAAAFDTMTNNELTNVRDHLTHIEQQATLESLIDLLLSALIGLPAEEVTTDKSLIMIRYEWLVTVGRRPYLQKRISELNDELNTLLTDMFYQSGRPIEAAQLEHLLTVIDGAVVRALSNGQDDPRSAAKQAAQRELS